MISGIILVLNTLQILSKDAYYIGTNEKMYILEILNKGSDINEKKI